MELFPSLEVEWLNGWVLLAFEFLIQGSLLLIFPKEVVSRLFSRSGWSVKQRVFLILGKVFSLACLILIILTPLKINSSAFIVGLILYTIGLIGLVAAMLNFKDTPLSQPVTKGVYKRSRHPQIVSLFFIFLGICVAIGSWAALFTLVMSKLFQHFGILAEEEVCLKRYGESYRAYMEKVPRYFLFF
ncbi:MAG: isoprenylcysteine carboxylmethyltransferase family protein [Anaerolineales bacterium]|nr:MAG: isoprenylcysteine carboxylmethyltransferase family protein [Anaerolineales bacterium]